MDTSADSHLLARAAIRFVRDARAPRGIRFCRVCQFPLNVTTVDPWPLDRIRIENFTTLSDMRATSAEGCSICFRLLEFFYGQIPVETPPLNMEDLGLGWIKYPGTSTIEVGFCNGGLSFEALYDRSSTFELIVAKEGSNVNGHDLDGQVSGSLIPPADMGSDATMSALAAWVEECCHSHSKCPNPLPQLPKRVLLINNRTWPPTVRLHESLGKQARYTCLSYCWGQFRPACLTFRSTLEANRQSIAWQSLPKLFQDAVIATSKLGLFYLWIDSMCIIQDDIQDWRAESAKMAAIYENAFITICAAAARSSNEGLFTQPPQHFKPSSLAADTDGTTVFVRRKHRHPYWHRMDSAFPLLSRAWAYQESLLSRRLIYFTNTEIVWECRGMRRFQCGLPETDDHVMISQTGRQMGWENVFDIWENIVRDYSRLSLTFQNDKLPALSGIATKVARHHRERLGRYVAGCWIGTLFEDLCWYHDSSDRVPRPSAWRAPTWSWISVDTPVQRVGAESLYNYVLSKAAVVDVECSLAGPDEFGELLSARLQLDARMFEGTLVYKVDPEGDTKNPCRIYTAHLRNPALKFVVHPDYDIPTPGPNHLPSGSSVYLMELVWRGLAYPGFWLVLKCVDQDRQIYERVGASRYTDNLGFTHNYPLEPKKTITIV
ncbi:heterokaryon incompatibility protein-domain-containing protein [Echria macrotheca]|uniref:Heterokaryon incompatibility protein-domain-containing protein n=1 Tax=Echria macrotheca TaxID=438768 RepID=A0AAJ0F944_9PEZI|nr:heterokaryon incompatibility protein-domain-containing protein [Echria macrotheca]